MDIDRYIAMHESTWRELDALTVQASSIGRRLDPAEVDRFVQLYQQATAHLSYVHTHYHDPALSARLSTTVGNASALIYSTPSHPGRALARFFTHAFPGAVWHARRFVVVSALVLFVPAIASTVWFANSERARNVAIPVEVQNAYIDYEFEEYYSSEAAAAFSAKVLTNNILVAIRAFAMGILLCIPTVLLLAYNGVNVGIAAGLFHSAGRWPKFYGLILPHGVLELSAIVVAGAAGLAIGWSLIAPGDTTRARALAAEGRRSVSILIGLAIAFVVAGLIEGFVTPSGLPTSVRVSIGVIVGLAFWMYIVVFGRAAADEGHDGSLGK